MTSSPHHPHSNNSLGENPEGMPGDQGGQGDQGDHDEELLQNVLQDIANQTKKEKKLFNQTLRQSPSESEYEKAKSNGYEEAEEIAQTYTDSGTTVPYANLGPSKMEVLKESFKWSAVVALILFIFSQPTIVNKLSQYFPSKLLTESGSLNLWGTASLSIIGAAIYFVLFHWVL